MEEGFDNSLRVDKHYLGYKGKPDNRSLAETCSKNFGAFANLRKVTVSFVMSVHPSVSLSVPILSLSPHEKSWLPLDGFS
jgi:hypothetical protein